MAVLTGFKGNDTAEDGSRDAPGAKGPQAGLRPHHAPRQLPKVLPQQLFPGTPRTQGNPPNFSSQGKKVRRRFFFFPTDGGMWGPHLPLLLELKAQERTLSSDRGGAEGSCYRKGRRRRLALRRFGPTVSGPPRWQGVLPGALTMPSEQLERGLEASDSPL